MTPLALIISTMALGRHTENRLIGHGIRPGSTHERDEAPSQRWINTGRTLAIRGAGESNAADIMPPYPATSCRFHSASSDCVRRRPSKQKRPRRTAFNFLVFLRKSGGGEGIRNLDPNLGKVGSSCRFSYPSSWLPAPCQLSMAYGSGPSGLGDGIHVGISNSR
jgi:hypothetical protein